MKFGRCAREQPLYTNLACRCADREPMKHLTGNAKPG
jgi:hypothetical protein